MSHSIEDDANETALVELAFFEFSTGAPHPLSATHTVSPPPLFEFPNACPHVEFLGDHVLISVWNNSSKAAVYLVQWKTGAVTFVSGFSKFVLSQAHTSLRSFVDYRRGRLAMDG